MFGLFSPSLTKLIESGVPLWFAPLCVSPAIGSFLGILIRRLPDGRSASWTRSECETCKGRLSAVDLVPVVSYLVLRGRCRSCGSAIASSHLLVELLGFAVAVWAACVDQDPVSLWSACVLGWTLVALAWIDAEHMRLPDILTLPLMAFGIALHAIVPSYGLIESITGAFAGYASFQAIALAYHGLRGREGLGAGDAKLLSAAGAWLGWSGLPDVVLLAALLAILAVIIMRTTSRFQYWGEALPFGPFLAASLWLNYLYGPVFFDFS